MKENRANSLKNIFVDFSPLCVWYGGWEAQFYSKGNGTEQEL